MNPNAEQTTIADRVSTELDSSPAVGRVLEVAAAGGHHLALTCPPGTATVLARWLVSILPPLDEPAALEVTAVHQLAEVRPPGTGWLTRPPLQVPDPRISVAGLVGSRLGRPGLVPLAHRGVLLLDPAPWFSPHALEVLLQPLDHQFISVSRVGANTIWPARIQLLLAAGPCTCPTPGPGGGCAAPARRHRGPDQVAEALLDRVDLHVNLDRPNTEALSDETEMRTVAGRVATARTAASQRWGRRRTNAEIPASVLCQRRWRPPPPAYARIQQLLNIGALAEHRHHHLLRIAWTLADLAGHGHPGLHDVTEAIQLGAEPIDWCTTTSQRSHPAGGDCRNQ